MKINYKEIIQSTNCWRLQKDMERGEKGQLAIAYKGGKPVKAATKKCLFDGKCGKYQPCMLQSPEQQVFGPDIEEIHVYGKSPLDSLRELGAGASSKLFLKTIDELPE
jgi:hypothetical protein